mmetsp:Transcript_37350/g.93820  ORF Transcript_37350/g.93820 Transcript_37350/m.93820 type:complete len:248 (-) Transcript_37350:199-942(-)
MVHQIEAQVVSTGQNVDHSRRNTSLSSDLCQEEWTQRSGRCRLQNDAVAHSQCGRDLPSSHQQAKVPRNHLSNDTERLVVLELGVHQLCPSSMVVKVTAHQRNVGITTLTNSLSVVQTLHHCQETLVLLKLTSQRVQVTSTLCSSEGTPLWIGSTSCSHRLVHVFYRVTVHHLAKDLAVGWVHTILVDSAGRMMKLAVNKETKLTIVSGNPLLSRGGTLGGSTILEFLHQRWRRSICAEGQTTSTTR